MLAYSFGCRSSKRVVVWQKKKNWTKNKLITIENIGWSSLSSSKCACFFKALDCVAGWWVCIFKKNWSAMIFTETLPNLIPKENLIEVQHSFFQIWFFIFLEFWDEFRNLIPNDFLYGRAKVVPHIFMLQEKKWRENKQTKIRENLNNIVVFCDLVPLILVYSHKSNQHSMRVCVYVQSKR